MEGTAPVAGHPLIQNVKGPKRPDWALLGKVNQNMETILFREKFLNWPDKSRLIKSDIERVAKKKVFLKRSFVAKTSQISSFRISCFVSSWLKAFVC